MNSRNAERVRHRSILRMHVRADGTVKKGLNQYEAAKARARGLNTYSCPICGRTHAGN